MLAIGMQGMVSLNLLQLIAREWLCWVEKVGSGQDQAGSGSASSHTHSMTGHIRCGVRAAIARTSKLTLCSPPWP
jgi:hypothetical protein